MLTPKNKALLKKMANPLSPSLIVGKGGIDEKLIASVAAALKAHELIKVKVLTDSRETLLASADELAAKSGSEIVQIVGRIVVLYKQRPERPTIVL